MPLEIQITGPGLHARHQLAEGQSVLIGRDSDCDVCLPDPERTVSRQHLVMWVEAGRMNLRVLSVVNGVDLATGELPPGGVATLDGGDSVLVGDYSITLKATVDEATADASSSGIVTRAMAGHSDDDPFGEWGFDATVVHRYTPYVAADSTSDMQASPAAAATTLPADLSALFKGLGIAPENPEAMSAAELEAAGRRIRMAMEGLLDLYQAKLDLNREMGADDRTMVVARENNPLKTDWALNTKLQYLFGSKPPAPAFAAPDAALADLVSELRVHDLAVTVASRAVLEGALREFEPERLEASIAQDKSQRGLLAKLMPWDAYAKFHASESSRMPQWLDRLFTRYFLPAYTRETTRIKQARTPRQ
jgi:predicted component of type VI protein secretion system